MDCDNGQFKYVLRFKDYQSKVLVKSVIPYTGHELSLESWIFIEKENSNCTIIQKDDNFVMGLENGDIYVSLKFNHDKEVKISDAGLILPTMQWIHMAIIYSGSHQKTSLYINGNKEFEIKTGHYMEWRSTSSEGNIQIGTSNPDKPFSGIIRDVRIWTLALSRDELHNSMLSSSITITNSLYGCWSLDIGGGFIATDTSLNKLHGHIHNCQWILEGTNQIASVAHRKEPKKKRPIPPSRPNEHDLHPPCSNNSNIPPAPLSSQPPLANWVYPTFPPYPYCYVPVPQVYSQPSYQYMNPYYPYQTKYHK